MNGVEKSFGKLALRNLAGRGDGKGLEPRQKTGQTRGLALLLLEFGLDLIKLLFENGDFFPPKHKEGSILTQIDKVGNFVYKPFHHGRRPNSKHTGSH